LLVLDSRLRGNDGVAVILGLDPRIWRRPAPVFARPCRRPRPHTMKEKHRSRNYSWSSSGLIRGSGDDRHEALRENRQRVTKNHFPREASCGRSQILKQVQDDIAALSCTAMPSGQYRQGLTLDLGYVHCAEPRPALTRSGGIRASHPERSEGSLVHGRRFFVAPLALLRMSGNHFFVHKLDREV